MISKLLWSAVKRSVDSTLSFCLLERTNCPLSTTVHSIIQNNFCRSKKPEQKDELDTLEFDVRRAFAPVTSVGQFRDRKSTKTFLEMICRYYATLKELIVISGEARSAANKGLELLKPVVNTSYPGISAILKVFRKKQEHERKGKIYYNVVQSYQNWTMVCLGTSSLELWTKIRAGPNPHPPPPPPFIRLAPLLERKANPPPNWEYE